MNPFENEPAEGERGLSTLRRFYEAEGAYLAAEGGDFSLIAATLDPECVIYQAASLPYGGVWRGHSGFEAWMKAFTREWSSLEVRGSEFYPHGDVVVSKSHVYAIARATGRHLDWPVLQFFRLRNDKILELWPFYWDTAALLAGREGSLSREIPVP